MDFHDRVQPVESGNRWVRTQDGGRRGGQGSGFQREEREEESEVSLPTDEVVFTGLEDAPGCDLHLLLAAYSLQQAVTSLEAHWLGFVLPDLSGPASEPRLR
ncbi:MAG: hypothetical protein HY319_07900 [Armatimonadetes bacterium]|nr:hypothetical protein [Armatimonadota bacterium]